VGKALPREKKKEGPFINIVKTVKRPRRDKGPLRFQKLGGGGGGGTLPTGGGVSFFKEKTWGLKAALRGKGKRPMAVFVKREGLVEECYAAEPAQKEGEGDRDARGVCVKKKPEIVKAAQKDRKSRPDKRWPKRSYGGRGGFKPKCIRRSTQKGKSHFPTEKGTGKGVWFAGGKDKQTPLKTTGK